MGQDQISKLQRDNEDILLENSKRLKTNQRRKMKIGGFKTNGSVASKMDRIKEKNDWLVLMAYQPS